MEISKGEEGRKSDSSGFLTPDTTVVGGITRRWSGGSNPFLTMKRFLEEKRGMATIIVGTRQNVKLRLNKCKFAIPTWMTHRPPTNCPPELSTLGCSLCRRGLSNNDISSNGFSSLLHFKSPLLLLCLHFQSRWLVDHRRQGYGRNYNNIYNDSTANVILTYFCMPHSSPAL